MMFWMLSAEKRFSSKIVDLQRRRGLSLCSPLYKYGTRRACSFSLSFSLSKMNLVYIAVLLLAITGYSSALLGNLFSGLFGSKCPIKVFNAKGSTFTGLKLYANEDTFRPVLETLSTYAKDCGVKIHVKQGFIKETSTMTTILLRDHSALSFRLGEAMEFELHDQDNKVLCNRLCMEKGPSRLSSLPEAQCFLRKLAANTDLEQEVMKPTVVMRRLQPTETLLTLHDKRKELQNKKCEKFQMD